MKYLLDTNVVIVYLKGQSLPLRMKFSSVSASDITVCSIVKAELYAGAAKSNNPQASRQQQDHFLNRFACLPFDESSAETYAQTRSVLERIGKPIGPLDTLIASIALANQLVLITHNTAEFQRIQGLQIEDWETP